MRNLWLAAVLGSSALAASTPSLADNQSVPSTAALMMVCTPLIQQGNLNPPAPANNLQTVQLCQNSCNTLPFESAINCKKSLNNLYFTSVAKINTDQLNQQLKKQGEDLSIFEKMSSMIQQQQAAPSAPVDNTQSESSVEPQKTPPPSSGAAPANPQPPVSYDNINW